MDLQSNNGNTEIVDPMVEDVWITDQMVETPHIMDPMKKDRRIDRSLIK